MWKSLQTVLGAVLVYFIDWSYGRMYVSVIGGFCIVALLYLLALPRELPLWPAVLIMLISGAVGILWESNISRRS